MSTIELVNTYKYWDLIKNLNEDIRRNLRNLLNFSLGEVSDIQESESLETETINVPDWIMNYKASPETLALTFENRKDLGDNYKELLEDALMEKYR